MPDRSPAPIPLLSVSGLTVRYGAVPALSNLDLSVESGEMFVLLGGSGSGKTTLLRAVAGFVQPENGRILLNGTDLAGLAPHRRPVNTMFQSYALFPHLSVASNVAFGLRYQNLTRAQREARIAEMLTLVNLQGFAGRRPHQLSGGQQQRVALARSLAPRPQLLLLDEPLSALDRNLREETRRELARLHRQLGTGFILVTHDQDEALAMATRIGVMENGRLAQTGTPAEIYERPATRFVAEFLGAANILPVVVRADGVTLDLPEQKVVVHAALPGQPGAALLALRPERLRLNGSNTPNMLSGVISELAYGGGTISCSVRLDSGVALRTEQPLMNGLASCRVSPGENVTVSWEPDACILLPP